MDTIGYQKTLDWFKQKGWIPFEYQKESWNAYLEKYSGIINAPTGSGKTYAGFLGAAIEELNNPTEVKFNKRTKTKISSGVKVLWVTPLRALAKDIRDALQQACDELGIDWNVELRTGDISSAEKQKQLKNIPDVLIITPESLHILLAQSDYSHLFRDLRLIVADEWHELLGNKRGVQVELAISRLAGLNRSNVESKSLRIFGISATIANLDEAKNVLLKSIHSEGRIIKSDIKKELDINTIYPPQIEKYTWAGHLGLQLAFEVISIIKNAKTTIIFANTRNHSELWYKTLLEQAPELNGLIGLHHGSISQTERLKIEEGLHTGDLKAVVATSSLDLGVDFRPVDTVVQVGSSKGIARFMQRAGRSGHSPNEKSKIFFLPTNTLELIEIAALRSAIKKEVFEGKELLDKPYDVLIQYLVTLAVGEGFNQQEIYNEVISTSTYQNLSREEWIWILKFITQGGESLKGYSQFNKVKLIDGIYKVVDKKIGTKHKISIGTITSDPSVKIQFTSGEYLGTIEEGFVAKLSPGDNFWFAGRNLELVMFKNSIVYVRRAKKLKDGVVPSWMGGRLPLSTQLSTEIKLQIEDYIEHIKNQDFDILEELKRLAPLLDVQNKISALPKSNQMLIEKFYSNEGYHTFFYLFLGRVTHEGLSSLIGYRLAQHTPITFSLAMNDYGFELLSDKPLPEYREELMYKEIFTTENITEDIIKSVNSVELAKRKFRDIARISGLIFQGYPGENMKFKNLQMSAELLFEVFKQYEPNSLIYQQSYQEVLKQVLDEQKIKQALNQIYNQELIIKNIDRPTPFSFPLIVDRLRDKLTSEKLEDRIKKMKVSFDD